MDHEAANGVETTGIEATAHFSPEEWARLGKSDRRAGRFVVVIVMSIFLFGLALYSYILATI